jgi:mono/diheme cytochrome c family protein
LIFLVGCPAGLPQRLEDTVREKIPDEYRGKQMPAGWWTDPDIIEEGKRIYEGKANPKVACAACHGRDGRPVLSTARDFRKHPSLHHVIDAYCYWRISEGVPNTAMSGFKQHLAEDQIWKVMAYIHTFYRNETEMQNNQGRAMARSESMLFHSKP